MAVYMHKSDSELTLEEGQNKPSLLATPAPQPTEMAKKVMYRDRMKSAPNAVAGANDGLGVGGNQIMSKPQTLDQQSMNPTEPPVMQKPAMTLSVRDLLKILEE
jgi:hypothetical protein